MPILNRAQKKAVTNAIINAAPGIVAGATTMVLTSSMISDIAKNLTADPSIQLLIGFGLNMATGFGTAKLFAGQSYSLTSATENIIQDIEAKED